MEVLYPCSTLIRTFLRTLFTPYCQVFLIPNIALCCVLLSSDDLALNLRMFSEICPKNALHELRPLSPWFLGAFLLIVFGSFTRLLCFKAMGTLFTFDVTIRPKHRIVNSGPYAVVRHPSYTGAIMISVGTWLLAFGPQSPAITCGWSTSSLLVTVIMALCLFIPAVICCSIVSERVPFEEQTLRDHFGQEWDEYTKRVPYQYITGII